MLLGLGCSGNISDVPLLGGVNADSGRRGRDLGPLRRAPTPGEGRGGGIEELIVRSDKLRWWWYQFKKDIRVRRYIPSAAQVAVLRETSLRLYFDRDEIGA